MIDKMLESVHVKNLALIEEQEVFFQKGMNVLTGETGAGKSLLIGSIHLALGAKADKDYIREGEEYALVELLFSLNERQAAQIRELELLGAGEEELLLQRKIMPGRSICRVNGETVTASQVRALSGYLLDLYGQHEHQSLLKPSSYLQMLDEYAGGKVGELKKQLKEVLISYRKAEQELEEQSVDEAQREHMARLLTFEIQEIEAAGLNPGEDEQVEKRYRRLLDSKKLKELAYEIHGLTGYEAEGGAGAQIGYALRELKPAASLDEELSPIIEQLTDIDGLLNDFNRSLAGYLESLEFDQEDFAELEERLNVLNHLKAKYGDSLEKVLLSLEQKQRELDRLEHFESYRRQLEEEKERTKEQILRLCRELSKLRSQAADPLGKRLLEAMQDLNFPDVKFTIQVMPKEDAFTAEGYDTVEFLISTNPGEQQKPLWQVASGGELSRIMLAFKTVFADREETDTLIFDEIDTGISGKTAWKVAQKLGELSCTHQVICITHLAQIAAMADNHIFIEKNVKGERTVTDLYPLGEEESLKELARLLGSGELTDAAYENARELRKEALKARGAEIS